MNFRIYAGRYILINLIYSYHFLFYADPNQGNGLKLGSQKAITMYYVLAVGLRAVLENAGRAGCWAYQILCGADLGSGLAFGKLSASLVQLGAVLEPALT